MKPLANYGGSWSVTDRGIACVPSPREVKKGHMRKRAQAARRAKGMTDEWNPKGCGYLNIARPRVGIDRAEGREESMLGGHQTRPLA